MKGEREGKGGGRSDRGVLFVFVYLWGGGLGCGEGEAVGELAT